MEAEGGEGEGEGDGTHVFPLLCIVRQNGFVLSPQGQSDVGITREGGGGRERERECSGIHIKCTRTCKYDEFMCVFCT
jgi:hypothetical protein